MIMLNDNKRAAISRKLIRDALRDITLNQNIHVGTNVGINVGTNEEKVIVLLKKDGRRMPLIGRIKT